jgi:hypothetical protein
MIFIVAVEGEDGPPIKYSVTRHAPDGESRAGCGDFDAVG